MNYHLCGPMRGYPRYNFEAFDAVAADLRSRGHNVTNPAEHDRAIGFDPDGPPPTRDQFRRMIGWDLGRICDPTTEAIYMLRGWQASEGVTRIELPVIEALGIEVEYQ